MNKSIRIGLLMCLFFMAWTTVALAATMLQVTVNENQTVVEPSAQEKLLQRGNRGDAVISLQKSLALAGFYNGEIDGIYGQETKNAVIAAQAAANFEKTGCANTELIALLRNQAESVSRGMRAMQMNVSAYSAADPGCGQYTYRGSRLRKGLCAVDPDVIPLGTRLYVPGYGIAIADDVGSAIKGPRMDLAFESRYEALNFGRRSLLVFILD